MAQRDPGTNVLVICHANICRSPLAHYLLTPVLGRLSWTVQSAGTHAREVTHMCRDVRAAIGDWPLTAEFADSFSSRPLADEDLRAPLILAASAEEKSALARRDHTTRRRAFTLREAAGLVALADPTTIKDVRGPGGLAGYLDELRRMARSRIGYASTSLDIEDPHRSRAASHATALDQTVEAVEALVMGLEPATS